MANKHRRPICGERIRRLLLCNAAAASDRLQPVPQTTWRLSRTFDSGRVTVEAAGSCTRTWPGRGVCAAWCAERLHRDALVTPVEASELLGATRRVKDHTGSPAPDFISARAKLRLPAEMVAIQIDLIDADSADHPLGAGGVRALRQRSSRYCCAISCSRIRKCSTIGRASSSTSRST